MMSSGRLPDLFGFVVHDVRVEDHGQVTLLTVEEYLGHRWFLVYQEEEGNWGICSRYILLETLLEAPDVSQMYAPILDIGVSLDDPAGVVVIEQDDDRRWVIEYLEDDGILFPERIIPMLNTVAECRVVSEELNGDERLAYRKFEELDPYLGEILGSTMVENRYERVVYVKEFLEDSYFVVVYKWVLGAWNMDSCFRSIGPQGADVGPYTGIIRDMLLEYDSDEPSLMVIEESDYIRWWHLYLPGEDRWFYCYSRQVLLESWERFGSEDEEGEGYNEGSIGDSPSLSEESGSSTYRTGYM
jgi:hypothetical protein